MPAYYNEHDPKAAAWLRELIRGGHIAPGDVDERSICDISPHELTGYSQQHFFAGIGGWSHALRLAGWADDRPVRTGSCPCQPFSAAGKGLGEKDERHLWPVFRDLITFGEPTITFGEQVASAAGRLWLARVRADLEGLGYAVGAADLCAAGVGSPNIRQRLYWMANARAPRRRALLRSVGANRGPSVKSDRHGDVGRLADADGGQSRHGRVQPGGKHGQQPEDGGAGCRMGDSDGTGSRARGQAATPNGHGRSALADGGVGNRGLQREEVGPQSRQAAERGSSLGFWSAYELIPCADGKARRIEPGSFPLAHGVSGRVGLLRGYGNAINPQLASEFIQACEEALKPAT